MKKFTCLLSLMLALCLITPVLSLAEETDGAQSSSGFSIGDVELAPIEEVEVPENTFGFSIGDVELSPVEEVEASQTAIDFSTDDPVLFTVDGEEYRWSQVEEEMEYLLAGGYLDYYDYYTAIEYMVQNHVIEKMIKTWDLEQFTAEEEEAFQAEAQAIWDNSVEANLVYFLTEDTEEGREQARIITEYQMMAMGYSVDLAVSQLKSAAVEERLIAKITEDYDTAVTEEEIRQLFEEVAAEDRAMYEGSIATYEMYTYYYGQESWYIPDGFRGITHILLEVDEALLSDYFAKLAALEEVDSIEETEEAVDAAPAVTQEDVDAAYNAILESRKEDIDAIYAWLENGESFENLIAIYGTDPGMQDAVTLAEGYPVHQESILWDSAFTEGAFSEKMVQPGDVSDPVVGSYGIHILYYLRDIPGGYVEMTDDIAAQIESYLSSQKVNPLVNEVMAQWQEECEVVYYEETINAAIEYANTIAE